MNHGCFASAMLNGFSLFGQERDAIVDEANYIPFE